MLTILMLYFFGSVSRLLHDDQLWTTTYFQTVLYITNWAPGRYAITFHLN